MSEACASPAEVFRAAVTHVGTQQGMATLLGVAQPSIWRWMRSKRGVPGEYVLKVEEAVQAATGITRHDLRPDLYPHESVPASSGAQFEHAR